MNTDALTAAREMSPLILRLRDRTEANRRIAEPVVERLLHARLCRMALVTELGGLELPVGESLDVYEVLAGAEASVGWIVWNNALPCLFSRYLEPAARKDLFGDPAWLYASSTRPTGRAVVEGHGYRVDGRWSLVSGCELVEWITLACIVEENGEPRMIGPGMPEMRFVFVRRGDFEILDTWNVGGLRGTGSHDVVVKELFVPHRWTVSPTDTGTVDAPIGRLPIICTMAAGFGAQFLGIAQSAIDTLVELTSTKLSPDPGPGLSERPAVQAAIARQAAAIQAARAYLRSCVDTLWDAVSSGASPTMDGIADVWAAAHHAVYAARSAVDTTYAAGGTSSLYTDCPLERAHRDTHAMSRHIIAQKFWLENAGRVKLGKSPDHPLFAI